MTLLITHHWDATKPKHSISLLIRWYIFPSFLQTLPDVSQPTWEYGLWVSTVIWLPQSLTTFNSSGGKERLRNTNLDLPNTPIFSLVFTVAHHFQHTIFQKKNSSSSMTLILSSWSNVSYFGLFSKNVQCTPGNRGRQLFHNKLLRTFGTAEHCCNCVIHHGFIPHCQSLSQPYE